MSTFTLKPICLPQHPEITHIVLHCVGKWERHCTADVTGQLPTERGFWRGAPASLSHRTPSPSGRGVVWAASRSRSYRTAQPGSTTTSGGARAGSAADSKSESPVSPPARQSRLFRGVVTFGTNATLLKILLLVEDSWLALTFTSLISTLLLHNTIGMASHMGLGSLCWLGTFL